MKTIYQEIKVLSCFKMQDSNNCRDKWKITCLREFDSFQGKDKEFKNKSFESVTMTSDIKLKKGANIVLVQIEESVEEHNGKVTLVEEVISRVLEDYDPGLDGLNPLVSGYAPQASYSPPPTSTFTPSHNSSKFDKSYPDFDYLSVIAQMNNYNVQNPSDRRKVKSYLMKMGLELTTDNTIYMAFENKDVGIRAYFSNYRSNKIERGFAPSLKFDFTGHFFMRENSDLVARKVILNFTKEFGALFHPTRLDICQDIYGAYAPFDYFPNFLEKDKYHWSLRTDPNSTFYHDSFSENATGFNVNTSRYSLVSYNRNIALEKKYAKGQITKEYYDFYSKKYAGRDVQRLELRLLQKDACAEFYKMFMHGESYEKERTLTYTLANFGRNHCLRDKGNETRESRYKENDVFQELFYLKEKYNFKIFRDCLEKKAGIKFNKMMFSLPEDRVNRSMRNFGKSFCLSNSQENIKSTLKGLTCIAGLRELTESIEKHKNIEDDRLNRIKKTLTFFNLDEEEMIETRQALNRGSNIAMSYG